MARSPAEKQQTMISWKLHRLARKEATVATAILAAWSTGADYIPGTTSDSGYPGTTTYWSGNAGRERLAFKNTATGAYAGRSIASLFDVINVMTYDAGYQNYDPVTAWTEYRALVPSSVAVSVGLEVATEGWGGATLVLHNSDTGAAGTVVTMDQYNRTPRGAYSVERFVGTVTGNAVNANAHDGAMVWDLQKTTAPTNADANSISTYVGTLFGWTAVAP